MKQSLLIASLVGVGSAINYPPSEPPHNGPEDALEEILSFEAALAGVDRIAQKEHLLGKEPITALRKRTDGDCHELPEGAAPLPALDTWEAFLDYPGYTSLAEGVEPPSTYEQSFEDLSASVSSPSYMGVYTIGAYNPQLCAGYCDVLPACVAFNLYISRDPSKDIGPNCPNPPATANIRCTLFSSPISAHLATNAGQSLPPPDAYGQVFEIKIRASNGYNKRINETDSEQPSIPDPVITPQENCTVMDGYQGPHELAGAIHHAIAKAYWIGTQFIHHRYNPSLCARLCNGITKSRRAAMRKQCRKRPHARYCNWQPCNYFNSYELVNEKTNQAGFYCSLFSRPMRDRHANITEVHYDHGRTYYVANSWGYAREPEEKGIMLGPSYEMQPQSFPAEEDPSQDQLDSDDAEDSDTASDVDTEQASDPAPAASHEPASPSNIAISADALTTGPSHSHTGIMRIKSTTTVYTGGPVETSTVVIEETEEQVEEMTPDTSETSIAVVEEIEQQVESTSTVAMIVSATTEYSTVVIPTTSTVVVVSPTTESVRMPVPTTATATIGHMHTTTEHEVLTETVTSTRTIAPVTTHVYVTITRNVTTTHYDYRPTTVTTTATQPVSTVRVQQVVPTTTTETMLQYVEITTRSMTVEPVTSTSTATATEVVVKEPTLARPSRSPTRRMRVITRTRYAIHSVLHPHHHEA